MTNVALIKNGKVANVIVAKDVDEALDLVGDNYDDAVASDVAHIGDAYDGKAFAAPKLNKQDLLTHAYMRLTDYRFITVQIKGLGAVRIDENMMPLLFSLADKPPAETAWPQPGGYIDVDDKQLKAMAAAASKHFADRLDAYRETIDGIESGEITGHAGVDDSTRWPTGMAEK